METVVLAVVSLLALLFAVAFGFALWGAGRLRNLLSAKERELLRLQVELENARQVAAVKDEAARKLQGEKERFFAAAVDTLKEQFSNIALSQMKEHSEGLAKTNRTNMEGLLAPVRDQVKALQELDRLLPDAVEENHRKVRKHGHGLVVVLNDFELARLDFREVQDVIDDR